MQAERANAKINLYLNVIGRRENGYHNIVSIMQTVSLCDLVTVDYRPAPQLSIELFASGNDTMPTDCRNLAWRAAETYLAAIGQSGAVRITIEKHIPMAAGLAGGSADAAAVLRAMNRLCGNRLTTEALCALGAKLGADIPFCIVGGGALVTGIGEELRAVEPMPQCHLVVACMGEGISTPWGYGKLDELHNNFADANPDDPRPESLLRAMREDRVFAHTSCFFNIFEEIVPPIRPRVDEIKQIMLDGGAQCAMMSGSGPSVFGLFSDLEHAGTAAEKLKKLGAAAFVCHPTAAYR
ncbi:MAG: 4-(cytidine 5'-diphospho)-2-C-methyl-D-erythritol kinase [Clostridia bacterium]|nr:4-(cytidine 5'-diphospho)-2-C-methyl-D-erythritol kinase [Clostridia bacterium]